VAALATAACGGMAPSSKTADEGNDHALVGAPAPPYDLPIRVGGSGNSSLADGAGKVMIVDFWATWCEPCKDSFPHYQQLLDKYAGKLVVVGVSVDDDPSGIADFAKQTGVSFPLVWDEGQALSASYQPPTMPTSYVIDANGVVRYVHAGFHKGDEEKIEANVAELLR